jgi:thiamine biosynthesis protein ThiS
MRLTVNGKPRDYDGPPALPALLQSLQIDQRHVAVARNGDVLRREEYEQVVLQEGDVLEIVHMVGGGAPELAEQGPSPQWADDLCQDWRSPSP